MAANDVRRDDGLDNRGALICGERGLDCRRGGIRDGDRRELGWFRDVGHRRRGLRAGVLRSNDSDCRGEKNRCHEQSNRDSHDFLLRR